MNSANKASRITRRDAVISTGKALAGVAGLADLPQLSEGGTAVTAKSQALPTPGTPPGEKLRVATCQFPVSGNPVENGNHIHDFMHRAVEDGR